METRKTTQCFIFIGTSTVLQQKVFCKLLSVCKYFYYNKHFGDYLMT